jgi:heptosyltransferase III
MHLTKKNSKVVILPCHGIGDALLMLIAAERLQSEGYEVVTVHPKLPELQPWFPHLNLKAEWLFSGDEWIIAENDNSERIGWLKKDHRPELSIFYPTYLASKHGEISPLDRVFDPAKPMAENIALATASLLQLEEPNKHNGITPLPHLRYRNRRHRVLIHHTSSSSEKNWLKEKFDEVAYGLRRRGYDPVFVQPCDTLSDLAGYIYESGFVIGNDSLIGHLASNLQIPTLIISDKSDRMKLWRPGWLEGSVVTLSPWIPAWKFFDTNWQYFISSYRVLRCFDNLARLF